MRLSIIITVFNKEPYLKRALDTLFSQKGVTKDHYEVWAVNDGSTDSSEAILEDYASRESRLRVLTQQNQGLSMARNNGLEAACGEYIWFVDADDHVSPNAVKLICDATQDSPDVIPIYAQTEGFKKTRNCIKPDSHTGKEVIIDRRWEQCAVFYVYRKSFLKGNDLRFLPGIYHEDAEFTPRMLYAAKSVVVVPEILYTVFRTPNSIMQVPRPKRAFDYLVVSENLSNFVVDNKEEGTSVGKAIDQYTAQDINNALDVIINNKEEQHQFNIAFYEKRHALLRVLKAAPQYKYHIEAILFGLLPKQYVLLYKIMKRID